MNLNDHRWHEKITLSLSAIQWISVHGNTCLGLRHPDNKGTSRSSAIDFLLKLEGKLLEKSLLSPEEVSLIHKTGY